MEIFAVCSIRYESDEEQTLLVEEHYGNEEGVGSFEICSSLTINDEVFLPVMVLATSIL